MNRAETDAFYAGVLVALGCIYDAGYATITEEIIAAVGSPYGLLRVARKNEDPCLPQLRKTVRYLQQRRERNETEG